MSIAINMGFQGLALHTESEQCNIYKKINWHSRERKSIMTHSEQNKKSARK